MVANSLIINSETGSISNYIYNNIKIINDNILTTSLQNNSIDLIITSPPYNLDIPYNSNNDKLEYEQYLSFSEAWMEVCYKAAKDDCRFCLNVPLDKNKNGHQSVYADLVTIAKKVGWHYFTSIVWNEGNISRRTAWGSWLSASAPYVIAPVEMIIVFYKMQWKKTLKGISDIDRDNFMSWTNGLWTFNGESKKRVKHPAPFPIELPKRCIQLFSYIDDTVLDPFSGSGTTMLACEMLDRKGIGIDIDSEYCNLSLKRLKAIYEDKTT